MLTAAILSVTAALPIIAVERAPGCPGASGLVEDLELQLDTVGRPGAATGTRGEYRLRVSSPSPEHLRIEVVDPSDRVRLARDLAGVSSGCGARSRAIAAMVERWLATLAVPPMGLGSRSVRSSERRTWLEAHGGPTLTVAIDPADAFAGLGLGLGVSPLERIRLAIDCAVHLPHQVDVAGGQASIIRAGLRARAAIVIWTGRLGVDIGPTARLDLTSVSTTGPPGESSTLRAAPGAGLAMGGSLRLGGQARVALLIEPWAALDAQAFFVRTPDPQEVHRTPGGGVQVDLGLVYGLL